jgi:hypothetical protein
VGGLFSLTFCLWQFDTFAYYKSTIKTQTCDMYPDWEKHAEYTCFIYFPHMALIKALVLLDCIICIKQLPRIDVSKVGGYGEETSN